MTNSMRKSVDEIVAAVLNDPDVLADKKRKEAMASRLGIDIENIQKTYQNLIDSWEAEFWGIQTGWAIMSWKIFGVGFGFGQIANTIDVFGYEEGQPLKYSVTYPDPKIERFLKKLQKTKPDVFQKLLRNIYEVRKLRDVMDAIETLSNREDIIMAYSTTTPNKLIAHNNASVDTILNSK